MSSSRNSQVAGRPFLEGQVALVTGAALRVGRTLALALASQGAAVAVHYRGSAREAEQVVSAIRRRGGQAVSFKADLADDRDCVQLIPQVSAALGPVRILINNASLFGEGLFQTTTLSEWDDNFDVNLRAPFRLSQAMAAQRGGRIHGNIINISDWRGLRPGTDHFAYTIAKAALVKMTESTALALAPRIRVNCLALGSILPPPNPQPGTVENLIAAIPLKQMGEPKDVAGAVLYLLGPGKFVTGETIVIDGGRVLVR